MERETIFIGFFSLLVALGLDLLVDSRTWSIIWLAGVALWGVCTHLTLSQRLEEREKEYREELRRMRSNGDTSTLK